MSDGGSVTCSVHRQWAAQATATGGALLGAVRRPPACYAAACTCPVYLYLISGPPGTPALAEQGCKLGRGPLALHSAAKSVHRSSGAQISGPEAGRRPSPSGEWRLGSRDRCKPRWGQQ